MSLSPAAAVPGTIVPRRNYSAPISSNRVDGVQLAAVRH